jgi:hypothetical protein
LFRAAGWRDALRTGRAQKHPVATGAPPLSRAGKRSGKACGYDRARPSMREVCGPPVVLLAPALPVSEHICVICGRLCRDLKFRA